MSMKSRLSTITAIALLSLPLVAQDLAQKSENRSVFRIVPTVSSNPTAGTGAGVTATALYYVDEDSSPSQAIVSGTYTDSKSYNIVAINKMFFKSDKWQSNTFAAHIYNNMAYTIPNALMPVLPPMTEEDNEVRYNASIYTAMQQFLYEAVPNFYAGAQLFYISQQFDALNDAGESFLQTRGIENSTRGGYGISLIYDTRSKSEKIYPKDAALINVTANHFPKAFGSEESYYNLMLNAREYTPGFKPNDVVAMQFYAQYSSPDTPDGALAALGGRNILRGFPIGLHKARNMLAAQGEYRYRIEGTRFRATAFAGYAHLSGGSAGTETGSRDTDNGSYYSGGVGVHYILAPKQQLDYRVNVAYTNEGELFVYASLNQAF